MPQGYWLVHISDDTLAVSLYCVPHAIGWLAHNTPHRRGSQYSIPLSRQLARIPCRRIGSRHALHAAGLEVSITGSAFLAIYSILAQARQSAFTRVPTLYPEIRVLRVVHFFLRAQKRRVRLKSTRHLIFYANRSKALRKSGKAAY